ncbi:MAG TPA: hypothetical protein VMH37_08995 [Candidatus Binataceae bacterium]|nr:hypothetical protein [Candidatus Binataceae bacterium]
MAIERINTHRKLLIMLAVALPAFSLGCLNKITGGHTPGELGITRTSQEKNLPEWVGKDRKALATKMGEPKLAVPMESGAEELYYSFEGHQYYFETDLKGNIQTAVQID